jgi:hypothetical protein
MHRTEEPTRLQLDFVDDHCSIIYGSKVPIGYMNRKTASELTSLEFLEQLRLEAFIDRSKLEDVISQYGAGTNKVTFFIEINMIGPQSLSEVVANDLCSRRLFLQRPEPILAGMEYRNPQYLECENQGVVEDGNDISSIGGYESFGSTNMDSFELSEPSGFEDKIWGIMDNLSRPLYLNRIDIDSDIINTELMK